MKQEFPRWKYHASACPDGKIFETEAAFLAAGKGWVDSPAYFKTDHSPETTKLVSVPLYEIEGKTVAEIVEKEIAEPLAEMVEETPKKPTKKPR